MSKKLTANGVVGLGFGHEYQRLGAFMAQAGGALVIDGSAVANSQENVDALNYVKEGLNAGNFAFAAKDLGAGWGGEAFGKQLAAMVIEGNWIGGAMTADYPGPRSTRSPSFRPGPLVRARCSTRTAGAWLLTARTSRPLSSWWSI